MDRGTERLERSVIGIIATSFHSDFSRMMVTRICERFKDQDVSLHIFLGMDSTRYLSDYDSGDTGMEIQYYSHFTYANFDELDMIIISGEAIYTENRGTTMEEVIENLPDIPKIIISSMEGSNAIHIKVDNYGSQKKMIEHMINEHGCKKIAFLSGNPSIPDARERLAAYKDCVREFGLNDGREIIAIGNFSPNCDKQVETLFSGDDIPEAIVCANDEMAVSAYRASKARGLKIGEDILITGFDDINIAAAMDPPLTTVRQGFDVLANEVGEAAYDYLVRGIMEDRILDTEIICRLSCGCKTYTVDESSAPPTEKRKEYLMSEYESLKQGHITQMKGILLLRSLLMQPGQITIKGFFTTLAERLVNIGITDSMVSIHERPVVIDGSQKIYRPTTQRLVMTTHDGNIQAFDIEEALEYSYDHSGDTQETRGLFEHTHTGIWSSYLLFYGDIQYGCWSVKLELTDAMAYYALSLEIGSAMRYLYLALEQQDMHSKLEIQNKILDHSARHDTLTGLYNRAGVFKYIYDTFSDQTDSLFIVVIADLDHLKQINDNFGHDAGDYAIIAASEILTEALEDHSRMGRIGGDEFACVFEKDDRHNAEKFIAKVKLLCQRENETNNKPFYVEISVGCYETDISELSDISKVLKKADDMLYEAKKHRRESALR
ncbi:MAG: GGDEF domain-containing protein [Lachnospiraceae bacterium]|nr:GGDEF domain-containing protein [Lachnospiraceae bacterium]